MNTTKQILILTLLTLLFTLGLTGCDVPGEGMYCEPMTTTGRCIDGSWPEACVSYDTERCGYKVRGVMFYCANCIPLICDEAAYDGINYCYRGYKGGGGRDGENEIDVDEMLELFINELEDLK